MALRRTLETLEAGEQIIDLLYRSTVVGSGSPSARRAGVSANEWRHLHGTRDVARRRALGFAIRHAGRRLGH
ncbi:MAG TPA: hypothetical protein VEW95_08010 [Candidatus Limnocylindrales bacterium]|nr:hypothetical protein [Candidatus Limnocylindrales bacterium]